MRDRRRRRRVLTRPAPARHVAMRTAPRAVARVHGGNQSAQRVAAARKGSAVPGNLGVARSLSKLAEPPVVKGAQGPASKTVEAPVKGAEAPVVKGAQGPASKTAEAPAVKGAEAPVVKGAESQVVKGAEAPAAKTAEAPAAKTAEAPAAKTAEAPAAKTAAAPAATATAPAPRPTSAARRSAAALSPRARVAATVITADASAKQAMATQVAMARVLQVNAFFAGVRSSVLGFVLSVLGGLKMRVVLGRLQLMSVVTAISGAALGLAFGLASVLTAGATAVIQRISTMVTSAVGRVRARVQVLTGRITGLIGSVPLPDVPGISTIRAKAVDLLGRAAGVVTSMLDGAVRAVQAVARVATALVTMLVLRAQLRVVRAIMRVTSRLLRVVQRVSRALLRVVSLVRRVVLQAVHAVLFPLLARAQALVVGRILAALGAALRLLRHNRDVHLAALDGGDAGAPGAVTVVDELQVALHAMLTSNRILTALRTVLGGAIGAVLARVRAVAARLRQALVAAAARALALLMGAVRFVLQTVRRVVAVVRSFLVSIVREVVSQITRVVKTVKRMVEEPLDAVVDFARGAVTRLLDVVTRFVRDLVARIGRVVTDVGTLLGAPRSTTAMVSPAFSGPIVPVPPPVLAPILAGLFVFFAAVGAVVLYVFPVLVPVVVFLMGLGLTQPWALAVIGLVVLLLLLLLLLVLLIVIVTIVLRRRRRRTGRIVLRVRARRPELGVGGRRLPVAATLSRSAALRWTVNPGGAVPAGISVRGTGRRVQVVAAHPPVGTVTGGSPITVRAEAATNPADFADTAPVMVVQITEVHYDSVAPLMPIPPNAPTPPLNTGEPNRDGVTGNSVTVVATTAPAGRVPRVGFRRSLGTRAAGTTLTPGTRTGDVRLRITDPASSARLDEARPSLVNPPTPMAVMIVNAVATRVSALTFVGRSPDGPYSARNLVSFASSDSEHPPLTRVVGELITGVRDDFDLDDPNNGFNNTFDPDLAVPADFWEDQLVSPDTLPNKTDGLPAFDVNRFVGPGVPGLPRRLIYRQRMVWARWQVPTPVSRPLADGQHIRSLVGTAPKFGFHIQHRFGGLFSNPAPEPYSGPPLIVLSGVTLTPDAPGATALAADNVATGQAVVTTTVAGRTVTWTVRRGDLSVTAGNPSVPPGTATLKAGSTSGRKVVRAADTRFGNRQVDGRVDVARVVLRRLSATPRRAPAGTSSVRVSVVADPGGRVLNWSVDAAAAAAGVTVNPPTTGPAAPAMAVDVVRPAGFTGLVLVTVTDSVLARRTASIRIRFG